MLLAAVIVLCIVMLVLGFLLPRASRRPERGAHRALGLGGRAGSKAPGPLGRWLAKPFFKSSKAVAKSAAAGRRGRDKVER